MSLTARPGIPVGQVAPAPLPLVVAGLAAGAGAAALSYGVLAVVALTAWMLDPAGAQEWTQMLEAASGAWLAGLGLAPTVNGVAVTLVPWGFALVPVVALIGAARWATEASAVARPGEAVSVAGSAAFGFAIVAMLVAMLSRHLDVSPVHAAISGAAIALVVVVITVSRRGGVLLRRPLPSALRDVAAAAGVAVLVLVVASSLGLAVAVVMHVADVTALLVSLDAGASGILLLTMLTLGYLPLAITWSMAYLLGPGITVSVGTVVSPYAETTTAALPGFPLLAALPAQPPAGGMLLPVVGLAAGALAGVLLRRRSRVGLREGLPAGVATGVIVGCFLALIAWLSSGSVGTSSLVGLGPSPLAMGLVGLALVAAGATAIAAWPRRSADG